MKRLGPAGLGSGRFSQSTVWALSHSLSVGGEANQLLAQENVAVQHVGYRMCKGKMSGPLLGCGYQHFAYLSTDSGSTGTIWFS